MITGLTHLHSSLRYLVLLFIVLAVVDAVMNMSSDKEYKKASKLFALLGLIFTHTQLLVGLLLYFLGDKGLKVITSVEGFMGMAPARFFAVEHITGMLIAIVLITMGYSKAKRQEVAKKKYSTVAIFYGIGLLIIFFSIPWPFLKEFGSWM
ncbi:MAG: hypothetical protein R2813_05975 [Flavobacteriales bacterium]